MPAMPNAITSQANQGKPPLGDFPLLCFLVFPLFKILPQAFFSLGAPPPERRLEVQANKLTWPFSVSYFINSSNVLSPLCDAGS